MEVDASMRAWRFEPLPETRTVTLVVGGSCIFDYVNASLIKRRKAFRMCREIVWSNVDIEGCGNLIWRGIMRIV